MSFTKCWSQGEDKDWERCSHIREVSQSIPHRKLDDSVEQPSSLELCCWSGWGGGGVGWGGGVCSSGASSGPWRIGSVQSCCSLHCPLDGATSYLCPAGPRDQEEFKECQRPCVSRGMGSGQPGACGILSPLGLA